MLQKTNTSLYDISPQMFSLPFTSGGFSFYKELINLLDTYSRSIIYLVRNRTGYRDIATSLPIVPLPHAEWFLGTSRACVPSTRTDMHFVGITLQPIRAIYFAKGDSKADGPYCFMYPKIARGLPADAVSIDSKQRF